MSVISNNILAGASGQAGGAAAGYEIERSLRFNSGDSAYLSKNFGSAGNRKTWTISTWVKRGKLGTFQAVFGSRPGTTPWSVMLFRDTDKLEWDTNTGFGDFTTTQVFRDPSAWYHIVLAIDSTQGPVADSVKLYINGERITTFDSISYPTLNQEGDWNTAVAHNIGAQGPPTYGDYGDFYQADFHFIDGLALPASAFGEPDANGVWSPKAIDTAPNDGTVWSTAGTITNADANNPLANVFDGSLSTYWFPQSNTTSRYTFPTPVSGSKFELYMHVSLAATNFSVNGQSSSNVTGSFGDQWVDVTDAVVASGLSGLSYIDISYSPAAWAQYIFAIRIDGVILVDGFNQFTNGTFYSNYGVSVNADPTPRLWKHAFDGSDGSYVTGDGSSNNQSLWTYPDGITVNTSLRLKLAGGTNSFVYVNGSQVAGVTGTSTGSPTWYTVTGVSNLTSIGVGNNGSTWSTLHQIEVDGTILTDATVGRNSFHLKFDDASSPAALGTDSANGNDWTVNNISLDTTTFDYAADGTSSGSWNSGASGFPLMFNGNLTNGANPAGGGGDATWTFGTPLTNVVKARALISADSSGQSFKVNNLTAATTTTFGWVTAYNDPNNPITVNSVTFTSSNAGGNTVFAIEINDVILVSTNAANNDSLFDSPTNGDPTLDTGLGGELSGNYATWNPLTKGSSVTVSNGNLDLSTSGTGSTCLGTMALTGGKWYMEATRTADAVFGVGNQNTGTSTNPGSGLGNSWTWYSNPSATMYWVDNGGFSSWTLSKSLSDTLQIAVDATDITSVKIYAGINNVWYDSTGSVTTSPDNSGTPTATITNGIDVFPLGGMPNTTASLYTNFGQRGYSYTAPSGFKALCTANLPTPDIADGSTAMNVALWTGDGTTSPRTITGLNHEPGLVWTKVRNNTLWHQLYDTVRTFADGKSLASNEPNIEGYNNSGQYGYVSGVANDEFTVTHGSNTPLYVNDSNKTYAAWTWSAGGAPTTDNVAGAGNVPTAGSVKVNGANSTSALAGSIAATRISANTSTGFSIVSYTGNETSGATVDHLLGTAPSLILTKRRTGASVNWGVYHSALGATKYLWLDTSNIAATDSSYWNDTEPTNSVFTVGNSGSTNALSMIAYCWAPVEGYSAFGSYTGTGVSPNFVYLGFRPKFLFIKNTNGANAWLMQDSSRATYNLIDNAIYAQGADLEYTSSSNFGVDFLSNGFAARTTGSYTVNSNNASEGHTILYAAFAEHPFKTARAR